MKFMLGCNYWASNAGTDMWRNWDEKAIKSDFEILSKHGVKYLRVFPNWRDFQPVYPLFDYGGTLREYRLADEKLPENKYFLDETMLNRFEKFCEMAEEHGLKLIVGILTGWMSGRLLIPPALFGKNLYTDPVALKFELKFIEGFVKRLKNYKAIYAWNLGNETNCMSKNDSPDVSEVWTGLICNAIKTNDNTRPIISGMHGITTEGAWRISAQADYTDMLTTHPYPYFVQHCSKDKFASMRTLLHATTETKYYSDLGGKPCLVEEIGNLGPMMCSDETAANFIKVNMFSNWAHGSTGLLWWCANEQAHLKHPPYCWNMCETELGMTDENRNPKPILLEMKKFSKWLEDLDFELPKANEDAVVLLTPGQDNWGVAYMTNILAKQAKLNVKFAYTKWDIPESNVYIIPSVKGMSFMYGYQFDALKEKVAQGATAYISVNDAVITKFREFTGLTVIDTATQSDSGSFEFEGKTITYSRDRIYTAEPSGATVLAKDEKGNPLVCEYAYGKGRVIFVNFPLENNMLNSEDIANTDQYHVYRSLFRNIIAEHPADSDCKYIGVTNHTDVSGAVYAVAINYSDKKQELNLKLQNGYKLEKIIRGDLNTIEPFETTIARLTK